MLKIFKTRKVKTPSRGTSGSAGLDLFIPTDLLKCDLPVGTETKTDPSTGYISEIIINPGDSVTIPSGIKVSIPNGHCIQLMNKSGIASKKNLIMGACLIDQDYQGEILVNVHNISGSYPAVVLAGEKLTQAVMYRVEMPDVQEVDSETTLFNGSDSERKDGGFGSTGME